MAAGSMPDYDYRPAIPGTPFMRTRSFIRARLFNDTYFRAVDAGGSGNRISVGIVQVGTTNPTGTLYVTNHNSKKAENIIFQNSGTKVDVDFLDVSEMNFNEKIICTPVSISNPSALKIIHSISVQIAPNGPITVENKDLGIMNLGSSFVVPGVCSFAFKTSTVIAPGDSITITPRVQSFPLSWITVTIDNPEGQAYIFNGWDIEALRALVNAKVAQSGWVEMMPRSSETPAVPGGQPVPIEPPFDVQDHGADSYVLATFSDAYLSGGDGLPETPDGERTGPSRSIIHINYGELYNGSMGNVNVVYEWSGDNHINGEWLNLFRAG